MGPGKVETLFSSLDAFLPWKHWDIIHFNTGLHDFGNRQGTAEEVAAYQRNLEIVIGKLKKTGAHLIWASTTPVPPDSPGTSNELAIRYNRAAAELMQRHGIPINDLHTSMLPHHEKYWLAPKNVHFNSSGSAFLGQLVAASIDIELKKLSH
jgi:acyl-CoA thioesterase-1